MLNEYNRRYTDRHTRTRLRCACKSTRTEGKCESVLISLSSHAARDFVAHTNLSATTSLHSNEWMAVAMVRSSPFLIPTALCCPSFACIRQIKKNAFTSKRWWRKLNVYASTGMCLRPRCHCICDSEKEKNHALCAVCTQQLICVLEKQPPNDVGMAQVPTFSTACTMMVSIAVPCRSPHSYRNWIFSPIQ